MKIALFGYGKMGKMIEGIATKRGHEIVARIGKDENPELNGADVAIDFSIPEAAYSNITHCFKQHTPVVSGTTGWLDKYSEAVEVCQQYKGAFIYASNFSLGVNLFFELNKKLAAMMSSTPSYKASMEEIHHVHKLDAPSGTAITLAEGIIDNSAYTAWTLGKAKDDALAIKAERTGEVPGTHTITWESQVDRIDITHTAHNREGFALGAVIAAEWLKDKEGVFSMKDVLNL